MGDMVKRIFGGPDKSGMKAQRSYNKELIDQIYEQAGLSRDDMLGLWPGAMQSRASGVQDALNVYGATIPQQLDAYQQGNVAAQQNLIAGMPQYQNAIMGLPVDYGAFQPQQINYDPAFAQQTPSMPGYDINAALSGIVPR